MSEKNKIRKLADRDWREEILERWKSIPGDLDEPIIVKVSVDPLAQMSTPDVISGCGVARRKAPR